ncbi:MAG TPA: 5'/3'-nucleotidase SurE [Thermoanaerobaculia bacterium]|nr:5'/3'-nucleotidase SurE [Thermoanaerobaculia bacterium]
MLSGINLGPNLGNSMWHSGTLAAAKQAALLGVQGIALSTPTAGGEPDFARLEPWVGEVLERVLGDRDLPLVNVNLPPDPRGLCWARQSVRHYDGAVVPAADPVGREHFWFVVRAIEEIEEGTDRWAMQQGLVSHPAAPGLDRPRAPGRRGAPPPGHGGCVGLVYTHGISQGGSP